MKKIITFVLAVITLLSILTIGVFAAEDASETAAQNSSIFDSALFNIGISKTGYSLTLKDALIVLGTALVLALAVAVMYILTNRKKGVSSSMVVTLFLIGPAVAAIVLCVGSNTARAISIGGGLAFIRFRNTVETPTDIVYILLTLAIGVACGIGSIGFAIIAAIIFCLILIIINVTGFDRIGGNNMLLKILVSESVNYSGVFDPVLKEFCTKFNLDKVKLTDYGTVLELNYSIRMKNKEEQKQLIDKIRERNGNLNITLVQNYTKQ